MEILLADPHDEAPRAVKRERLERTGPRAMARMRFELSWHSSAAEHTDCYVATAVNLWRDIFPAQLEQQIMDKSVGHRITEEFAPGELVPPWRADLQIAVRDDQFNRRFGRRGSVQPRAGRFYPRGILTGVADVFREDWRPLRVLEVGASQLLIDLNHPLADRTLKMDVRIEDIWSAGAEHGGRCSEIGEMVSEGGPGLQARWQDLRTDFWSDLPFLRKDPRPDDEFYAKPRFVDHLDRAALAQVSGLYERLLPAGARILDLMTSWRSHLPPALEPSQVVGLGMNADELAANEALTEHQIQDLNRNPKLAFADASFDAVVCTASVEYLTRPFEVFREVARVLRPGGLFVVTFSNRWFPPKAIQIWDGIHEFERPGLVGEYFLESGLFAGLHTWSIRGLPRPEDDKYADRLATSDPVFALWAHCA